MTACGALTFPHLLDLDDSSLVVLEVLEAALVLLPRLVP